MYKVSRSSTKLWFSDASTDWTCRWGHWSLRWGHWSLRIRICILHKEEGIPDNMNHCDITSCFSNSFFQSLYL